MLLMDSVLLASLRHFPKKVLDKCTFIIANLQQWKTIHVVPDNCMAGIGGYRCKWN